MVEQKSESIIRKMALPLAVIIKDAIFDDGFYVITQKDTRKLRILGIDEDGQLKCEIFPSPKEKIAIGNMVVRDSDVFLGARESKTRGSGKARAL